MKRNDTVYYKFSDRYYVRARVKTASRSGFAVLIPLFFIDTYNDRQVPGYIGGEVRMKQEKVFNEIPSDQ